MKFISQETSSLQCRCRSLKESLFSLLQRRNVKTCTKMRAFYHLRQRVGAYTTNVSPHAQDRIPDMEGRKLDFSAASGTAANIFCQEGVIQNQFEAAVNGAGTCQSPYWNILITSCSVSAALSRFPCRLGVRRVLASSPLETLLSLFWGSSRDLDIRLLVALGLQQCPANSSSCASSCD